MAEGGDLHLSMYDGSDVVLELVCSPCEDDGTTEEAAHYCQECKQYLCVTCTKYHKRFPATRNHLLCMANDNLIGSGRIQQAAPDIAKCHFHPERDIEMYCGTHDMVYCTLCIAKEHRSCIDVSEVDDVASTTLDSTAVDLLISDTDKVCKKMDEAKMKKESQLSHMASMKTELLKEIREVRKKLSQHLDGLEEKAVTEVDLKYTGLENEVQADVTAIDVLSCSLRKSKLNFNKHGHTNDKQHFVQVKLCARVVCDAEALLRTANLVDENIISFTRNKELYESVTMAVAMGTVQRDIGNIRKPQALTLLSRSDINVSENENKVCAICQLPDGTIVLAEETSKKVMRLDVDYNVRDYCTLNYGIVGICCTGENEIAVKLTSNQLQYVSIGTELVPTKTVDILGGSFNYGIASCSGKFWVSDDKGINIYDASGRLKKRIEYDRSGKQIFQKVVNHLTVDNDAATVYVTDFDNRVVAFGRDGSMIRVLSDTRLHRARGVCVARDGIILASCYISGIIVMFGADGSCLGELVSSTDGLKNVMSLCYDKKMHRVICGGVKSNITVYELGE